MKDGKAEHTELELLQQIETLDKLSGTFVLIAEHDTGKYYRNDTEEISRQQFEDLAQLARKLAPFRPMEEELPGRVEIKSSMHLIREVSRDAVTLI
jgi:hypothetical protein